METFPHLKVKIKLCRCFILLIKFIRTLKFEKISGFEYKIEIFESLLRQSKKAVKISNEQLTSKIVLSTS